MQDTVGHPGQKILDSRRSGGKKLRDVAAVQDVFECGQNRGKDVWTPLGGDEATAVEKNQPSSNSEEGEHELASLFGDQQACGKERNGQLEPDGLVHDVVAEGEEDKEEDVLQIEESVAVLLKRADGGDDSGLCRLVDPAIAQVDACHGQHGGCSGGIMVCGGGY